VSDGLIAQYSDWAVNLTADELASLLCWVKGSFCSL